jgi:hypothetical protein
MERLLDRGSCEPKQKPAATWPRRSETSAFVKPGVRSWMPENHFWRDAQAGSARLCPRGALFPMQIDGRTLRAQRCAYGDLQVPTSYGFGPAFGSRRAWSGVCSRKLRCSG